MSFTSWLRNLRSFAVSDDRRAKVVGQRAADPPKRYRPQSRSPGRPLPAQLQPGRELPRRPEPAGRGDGRLQQRRPARPRRRRTTAATPSACCWATATARSSRPWTSAPVRGHDSLAVGDFNGDGRLDLASANRRSASISVLLGNGDGTFGAARTPTSVRFLSPWRRGTSTATTGRTWW